MKAEKLAVIVRLSNGKVHQVVLSKQQEDIVFQLIHSGKSIKVLDPPLEGIEILDNDKR